MELTGRTAIVTGAGQGIGRGIALVLAERGASVVLNGRTRAKLAAVKKEIDAAGGQCVVAAGDVGSRSDVAGVVEAALGAFGGIDIMAKEAIRGLSRIAAREWGPDGIRVNVICPAAMSPSAAAFAERSPERFRRVLRGIPAGRFGDPLTDIGRAVAGLVSDDFSYLTGATLMLDGGRTLIS